MMILFYILMIMLLFGATIFVHELGHFLVARWCGLKIDAFSIGFGPAILKKEINGVVYKWGILPLGGYVALPQMDPTGGELSKKAALEGQAPAEAPPYIEPWKKMLVAVAGATMNILFAFVLACVVWQVGKPSDPGQRPCIIDYVEADSAAAEAGFKEGDHVLRANGEKVENWNKLFLLGALNKELDIELQQPGEELRNISFQTVTNRLGFYSVPGIDFYNTLQVGLVSTNLPAEAAGVLAGDVFISLNGEKVRSVKKFIASIQESKEQPILLTMKRYQPREDPHDPTLGETLEFTLHPQLEDDGQYRVGIQFKYLEVTVHPKPLDQMRYFSSTIFRTLKALTNKKEARQAGGAISGPVGIIGHFWRVVHGGLGLALWFTALLNVNLAIVNLLPIPILDGGHIVFAIYEQVFRKPVHTRIVMALTNIFFVLIISAFLFLSYRDVLLQQKLNRMGAEQEAQAAAQVDPEEPAPPAVTNQVDQVEVPLPETP